MAKRKVTRLRTVKAQTEAQDAYHLVSVVWSEATLHTCDSIKAVASKVQELVSLHGIHNVQIFVIGGGRRVKVLLSGDPLSPVVRLVDGENVADTTTDSSQFLESSDGFLYQRDAAKTETETTTEESDGFGFFDFANG